MVSRIQLSNFYNQILNPSLFKDYGPNGLQIEGALEIKKIAFAVSACAESIQDAISWKADALVVHHGLFWNFHGVRTLTGAFGHRVNSLVKAEMNLFSYHLPLDAHLKLGNAAAIASKLNLTEVKPFGDYKAMPIGVKGIFPEIDVDTLKLKLELILNHRIILSANDHQKMVSSIGIITGGANSQWTFAKDDHLDVYLTGEISEHDWHEAKESNIVFMAGGHYATEQFGIQNLMQETQIHFPDLELKFFPSLNPA